ncbi:MAG: DNA mismatch repair endonuclease MutL [Clostridia bacterium]|nr:DNA mismatch repair endonuclease MutL [Clostridia bacterium]
MPEIKVLPPHVANLIAAGEVVERPSSVVKELVENAIDAGADAVSVEILNGGIDEIRVTDNGSGIDASDCRTAFLPHATSKIRTPEDISMIGTLGFRGEALASIASVSEITMKTRTKDCESGTEIMIHYGKVVSETPCACPAGTSIEVLNLFSKTPARYKFLKSARTEAGYIGDYLSRMIMAYPNIAFTYVNNGKTVYRSYGDGDLKTAIYAIYGSDLVRCIREVGYSDGYISVSGFIGTGELSYPNRSRLSFFLNQRYINSRSVGFAVVDAYQTKLMSGRFPYAVLNLSLDIREVDVNVHPSKMEVRFADERRVCDAVLNACRNTLEGTKRSVEKPVFYGREVQHEPDKRPAAVSVPTPASTNFHHADTVYAGPRSDVAVSYKTSGGFSVKTVSEQPKDTLPVFNIRKRSSDIQEPGPQLDTFDGDPVKIVGAVFSGYWIVEQGDKVFFIDQHAAHERTLYEKYMSREIETASQRLLTPIHVRVTDIEYEALKSNLDEISAFGYELEFPDDGHSVDVCATPVLNGAILPPVSVIDVADGLASGVRPDAKDYCRSVLIQSSCKHAIKVTESISNEEIARLLRQFQENGIPLTCPHGRPVMVCYTKLDFEKMFKRVF